VTLDIVAVGDSVVDVVIPISRFLRGNEDSLQSDGMERHMGGSSNYLIMASRLGLRAGVVDCIGDDDLGNFYRTGLDAEGVDTSNLRIRIGGKTSGCLVLLTRRGKHAYVGLDGVSRTLAANELDEKYVTSARAFFLSGYPLAETPISNAVIKAMRAASGAGRHVFFDPSPVVDTISAEILREALNATDTLILNDREMSLIASKFGIESKPEKLLSLGAGRIVLKRGAEGCSFCTASKIENYPGFKVKVVDTTGAGDSFDAAIVYGTLRGLPQRDVATLANAVGAIKVGKKAAGRNVPTMEEIKDFLEERSLSLAGLLDEL
jgi:sugar/nucleoside kinase (ribokinase family)